MAWLDSNESIIIILRFFRIIFIIILSNIVVAFRSNNYEVRKLFFLINNLIILLLYFSVEISEVINGSIASYFYLITYRELRGLAIFLKYNSFYYNIIYWITLLYL